VFLIAILLYAGQDNIRNWLDHRKGRCRIRPNNLWLAGEGRDNRVINIEVIKVLRGQSKDNPYYEEIADLTMQHGSPILGVSHRRIEAFWDSFSKGFTKRRIIRIRPENDLDVALKRIKRYEAAIQQVHGQLKKKERPIEQEMLRMMAPILAVKNATRPPPLADPRKKGKQMQMPPEDDFYG
jgi:hypothetical protein